MNSAQISSLIFSIQFFFSSELTTSYRKLSHRYRLFSSQLSMLISSHKEKKLPGFSLTTVHALLFDSALTLNYSCLLSFVLPGYLCLQRSPNFTRNFVAFYRAMVSIASGIDPKWLSPITTLLTLLRFRNTDFHSIIRPMTEIRDESIGPSLGAQIL